MKKMFVFAMLLIFSAASFEQTNSSKSLTRADYMKKSRNQKSSAWLLLGGGTGLIIIGVAVNQPSYSVDWNNILNSSSSPGGGGQIVIAIGAIAIAGSVPLFIAAERNKRKAMAPTASFKLENIPSVRGYKIIYSSFPALSVKINLNQVSKKYFHATSY